MGRFGLVLKNSTFADPLKKALFGQNRSCPYVWSWDFKNEVFARPLKIVFLGQLGLIKRLKTLLGRGKCVLFTENGFWAEIGQNRILKVLVQTGQNRDFGTSQTGTFGRLPVIKFCLRTIVASKQWLVSFEPRKMSFRWNWRVPKWRFSRFSHFGEKSAILRKPHLELFLASNRALNAENVLFKPRMSSKTSLGVFCSDRSKSKNFRKIKVPTHALRPKNAQIRKIDLGRTRPEKYLLSWKLF